MFNSQISRSLCGYCLERISNLETNKMYISDEPLTMGSVKTMEGKAYHTNKHYTGLTRGSQVMVFSPQVETGVDQDFPLRLVVEGKIIHAKSV